VEIILEVGESDHTARADDSVNLGIYRGSHLAGLRSLFAEKGRPRRAANIASTASQSIRLGVIVNLIVSYSACVGLLMVSILSAAAFCAGQSDPQTQPSDPAQSTQSRATSSSKQDKPADQASAQGDSQNPGSPAQQDTKKPKDDRMFYVMPNYLTVDGQSQVKPVSWKEKFAMAAKGSFDPYEFTIVGVVAGIRQAENAYPAFGQGMEGYAKRYGAAFADQVDGNVMVGGVYPTILKIDPRYFRLGRSSFVRRFCYAFDRIFIARTDSGSHVFNVPEFAGNATAIAISNVYYPASDRGFTTSLSSWGTQMSIDAFGNELKEFWPDIHHYLQRRHERHMQKQQQKAAD
jgi:hypothetical protein